jgi:hypothetical protein
MARLQDVRNELVDRLAVPLQVWSMSGRDVQIVASLETDLDVGGFIVVTTPAGLQLLAQITELQIGEREGATVKLDGDEIGPMAGAAHLTADVTLMLRYISGAGRVLGEPPRPLDSKRAGSDWQRRVRSRRFCNRDAAIRPGSLWVPPAMAMWLRC